MIYKKLLLISAGSLLTVASILNVTGQKATTNVSDTSVLTTTPVMLLEENGQEAVFLELPSHKQKNQLSDLLGQNPQLTEDKNVHRQVYKTKLIGFDKQQKNKSSKAFNRQEVKFKDEITAQEYTLDLLSYEGNNGQFFVAEPGSKTPRLIPKPTDASQQLFQYNDGLYILDTKTLQVKALSDEQARYATFQRKKDLPDLGIENGRILYWAKQPNWSSDGSTIAFMSNRDQIETNHIGVWIHDVATNQESKVYETDNVTPHILGWTADNRILINEYNHGGGTGALVAIAPKTKQRQELVSGDFIAQSDDRQTVLYTKRNSTDADLYALNTSTGTSELLYQLPAEESLGTGQVDFSADGTRIAIALVNRKTGVESLFVYNLQNKNAKRLELPQGKTFYGRMTVKWVGDELAVPVESRNLNLQNSTSETLLMSAF
nr:PD40 domain-containing protein [Hassalia byssoidea]